MKKLIFILLLTPLLSSLTISNVACTSKSNKTLPDINPKTGAVSVIQVGTSETETYINILRGRHAQYKYQVESQGELVGEVTVYKTVRLDPSQHWIVDKLHISDLNPHIMYNLIIHDERYKRVVETRQFSTFNLDRRNLQFVVASCMSDHHNFGHVRNKIWQQVNKLNPDLILLLGDNVYVDNLDFINPKKVTAQDIWLRYVSTIRTVPLYNQRKLVPVLATWDDHDYGLNNSDKNFSSKWHAKNAFMAFYGSPSIKSVVEFHKDNIYFQFRGFGQRFLFLDNRFFREPLVRGSNRASKDAFGFFGKEQHTWAISKLNESPMPTWVASGGQFFSPPFKLKDGRQINESFMNDYEKNHKKFVNDLKASPSPVAFLSGDIHFSEVLKLESELLGYETYEFTSSPMHAFIFRANEEQDEFFENPRRIHAIKDYNFLFVESSIDSENNWSVNVQSLGPKSSKPFFKDSFRIKK